MIRLQITLDIDPDDENDCSPYVTEAVTRLRDTFIQISEFAQDSQYFENVLTKSSIDWNAV